MLDSRVFTVVGPFADVAWLQSNLIEPDTHVTVLMKPIIFV